MKFNSLSQCVSFYSLTCICMFSLSIHGWGNSHSEIIKQADINAQNANQALIHCYDFLHGWLKHSDPKTGLIPRNLTNSWFWNARDAAADNYPFMVLTSAFVEPGLFNTTMMEMLESETKLTNRLDQLPDDFDFTSQGFRTEKSDLDSMIFGGSEYVKDGLMPLTEWLGQSPISAKITIYFRSRIFLPANYVFEVILGVNTI